MPHLSPMLWLFAMITFWIILTTFIAIQWWNTPLSFPHMNYSVLKYKFHNWNWKYFFSINCTSSFQVESFIYKKK